MSSQKKKDDDKKDSKIVSNTRYKHLKESESSDESEKLPPPQKEPADKHGDPSTSSKPKSTGARGKEKGAMGKMRSSRSSTDTSCKAVTESKCVRSSRSEQEFTPIFKSAGTSKAKAKSKSPFKFRVRRRSRSESISPKKKHQLNPVKALNPEEKERLVDHQDGVLRVIPEKQIPPPEKKRGKGQRASNKDLRIPERDLSDDESTSKSSISETSSVSAATRGLNINPHDDKSEEPVSKNLRSSASAPKSSGDSEKGASSSDSEKGESSGDSEKGAKSKRKKK